MSDETDAEPEPVECGNCHLRFNVIASTDEWMSYGHKFDNYCPRCGQLMPDREEW